MEAESLDLIVGSDLVYGGPKNGMLLLSAIGQILRLYGHPQTTVMLAFGCRCRGTAEHQDFLRAAASKFAISHLEADEVVLSLPAVCKRLGEMAEEALVLASLLGCLPGADAPAQPREASEVLSAYPGGRFLAEGGFKRVFRVKNAAQRRMEAMGVLDLRSMRKRGLGEQREEEKQAGDRPSAAVTAAAAALRAAAAVLAAFKSAAASAVALADPAALRHAPHSSLCACRGDAAAN